MSKIAILELVDWESHDTHLEFADNVNVIVGQSHKGKSGIIRAFDWVRNNRPSGTPFYPRGKKKPETIVSVELYNGDYISKIRSAKENKYETSDGEFTALRSGVPEEVSSILNMSEVNLQLQKDVHFMLTESAGKRAKMLNEVAGLEDMDNAIDLINQKYRKVNSEFNSKTENLKHLEEQYAQLSWVGHAKEDDEVLSKLEANIKDIENKIVKVENILDKIDVLQDRLDALPNTDCLDNIKDIDTDHEQIYKMSVNRSKLKKRINASLSLEKELSNMTLPTDTLINEFEAVSAQIEEIKKKKVLVRIGLHEINTLNDKLTQAVNNIECLEEEESKFMASFNVCPFCKQEIA